MKTNIILEVHGKQIPDKELVEKAKEYWKADGKLIKDIDTLDIYLKPEEHCAYYSINDEEQKGRIEF